MMVKPQPGTIINTYLMQVGPIPGHLDHDTIYNSLRSIFQARGPVCFMFLHKVSSLKHDYYSRCSSYYEISEIFICHINMMHEKLQNKPFSSERSEGQQYWEAGEVWICCFRREGRRPESAENRKHCIQWRNYD